MMTTENAMTAARIGSAARTLRTEVFALQELGTPDLNARLFPPGIAADHLIADLDQLIGACFQEIERFDIDHDLAAYIEDIENDGKGLP